MGRKACFHYTMKSPELRVEFLTRAGARLWARERVGYPWVSPAPERARAGQLAPVPAANGETGHQEADAGGQEDSETE